MTCEANNGIVLCKLVLLRQCCLLLHTNTVTRLPLQRCCCLLEAVVLREDVGDA